MHDRLFKSGHFRKLLVDMQLKHITGKPVNQGLVLGRFSFNHKVRIPVRENNLFSRRILSAKTAVQAGKNRHDAGEQFLAVGMGSFKLGNYQSSLILAFVEIMFNRSLGR